MVYQERCQDSVPVQLKTTVVAPRVLDPSSAIGSTEEESSSEPTRDIKPLHQIQIWGGQYLLYVVLQVSYVEECDIRQVEESDGCCKDHSDRLQPWCVEATEGINDMNCESEGESNVKEPGAGVTRETCSHVVVETSVESSLADYPVEHQDTYY